MSDNGEKNVSFKWIAGVLVSLIFIVFAGIIGDTRLNMSEAKSRIDQMQKEKVDVGQYRCDIERMENKLDKLITMHLKDRK